MTTPRPEERTDRRSPSRIYVGVLAIQALVLLALWWLQTAFS